MEIALFFINEPVADKINELFEISYPLDKDLLLIFPEGMTNIHEINQLDSNFNKISNGSSIEIKSSVFSNIFFLNFVTLYFEFIKLF